MKALAKLKPEPGIWLTEAPIPEIGPNDVLIKIKKSAICGTDVHIYNWDEWSASTVPIPLITGHEYVGEIVELGSEVSGFQVGDIVSGEGHITCGHCRNCRAGRRHLCPNTLGVGVQRQGSFAEYFSLPAGNAFLVPESVPLDVAAILDPLGNAVHTALTFDLVGEDVLITGAGPIGIMAAAICRFVGARNVVITDINEERLRLAEQFGVTRAVNVADPSLNMRDVMTEIGMVEGFDVALEMSGAPAAFDLMFDTVINGGRIALLGIPGSSMQIDWNTVIFKGLTLQGIYGRQMFETWYKMRAMLAAGLDVSGVITHRFDIDDYEAGFSTMRGGSCGKVILNWP